MTNQEQPPSIGEQLRLAREGRKLSLEQAAYQTHIRLSYLTALETDELSAFPSTAQARGFLRSYASHLGLETETLVALMDGKAPATRAASPVRALPDRGGNIDVNGEEWDEEAETRPSAVGDASFIVNGQKLRTQRELLGLSIEDVERHSHIRAHYLKALEAGRLDDLPSPVQGRGMLTNYANFLGLDPEPLLLRYAEGLQERLSFRQRARQPAKVQRPGGKTGPRRRLPLDLIAGGLVALAMLSFLVWGAVRISEMVSQTTPEATGPSIAEVLSGDSTATPTPTFTLAAQSAVTGTLESTPTLPAPVGNTTSTPEPPTPTPNSAPVQVYISALERCWMRVAVDGEVVFEGRTQPGGTYPYSAKERVDLKTGNGAALKVLYNQNDLGVLGSLGEVIERTFTVSGVQLPTPTITPTPLPPTATEPVTPTPTGTALP
ncbi:MAG: helix-turn-helix domain-containing protein [Chloroflexota bacterium]